jgi:hypothetical protein
MQCVIAYMGKQMVNTEPDCSRLGLHNFEHMNGASLDEGAYGSELEGAF